MSERTQYQVFLFAAAQTELGVAVEPHLRAGPEGAHLLCDEINASGPLFSMKLAPLPVDVVAAAPAGVAADAHAHANANANAPTDPATPVDPAAPGAVKMTPQLVGHSGRQLMVPVAMIKLVVAVEDDNAFGFARRSHTSGATPAGQDPKD